VSDVEREIMSLLMQDLVVADADAPLTAATPLIEGGLNLDSVNLLELLVRVEETFGITVEDEEIRAEILTTIGTLAGFGGDKLAAGPSASRADPD
jgi:acyl carrier protein